MSEKQTNQVVSTDGQNLTFNELAHGFGVEKIFQLQQQKKIKVQDETIKTQDQELKKLRAELQKK